MLAVELKISGGVIGLVGAAPKRRLGGEIEIFFLIADEYQGEGYGTEAAAAMLWRAFNKAGQDVISALVKPENVGSRQVLEKLSFVFCGVRELPYDKEICRFNYLRRYNTDFLPGLNGIFQYGKTPSLWGTFLMLEPRCITGIC